MSPRRRRLDVEVTERGLTASRARAQSLILAGRIRVDGVMVDKAGAQVLPDAQIELIEPDHPWVSRGGLKLVQALDTFELSPDGLDCLDVGASTGGFTHVLLERGAMRVIALDVGKGQLDWSLRSDDRVTVMEGINARHLGPDDLPFPVAAISIDVSFISLTKVVPALLPHLQDGGWLVCLVKPQFEAGREQVGKGGIVRDEEVRRTVIDEVVAKLSDLGLELIGIVESPVRGQKGNLEELAGFRKRES
ncbi:MAG: TlyA family RNA methyltransferase [bacterium]|nr:TlyA family RNA methyltransferase [bacterium]